MKRKIIYLSCALVLMLAGVYLINQPKNITQVFALQVEQNNVNTKDITSDVGTITGEGFYTAGQTANLKIVLNPGYTFLGWYKVGDSEPLSTESEYTFTVSNNMNIEARYELTKYTVNLSSDLSDDFTLTVKKGEFDEGDNFVENTESNDINYQNLVEITITKKNGKLINDLTKESFKFNGELLEDCTPNNDLGFESMVTYLTITENVTIDIDYKYIREFTIQSDQNSEAKIIDIKNLINISGDLYYRDDKQGLYNSNITANGTEGSYSYYVVDKEKNEPGSIKLVLESNTVYEFQFYRISGTEYIASSETHNVDSTKICYIKYNKIPYNVSFIPMVYNSEVVFDWSDLFSEDLNTISLKAGEQITIKQTNTNNILNSVTINNIEYTTKSVFGYTFYGFGINGDSQGVNQTTIKMDNVNPNDITVQIYFQYITYKPNIKIVYNNQVDDYFKNIISTNLSTNSFKIGDEVTLSATSSVCNILGWKNGYDSATYLSNDSEYTFTFNPTSNDRNIMYYLVIDYKDLDLTFNLNNISYSEVVYDQVELDSINQYIKFIDTSSKAESIEFGYEDYSVEESGVLTINNNDYITSLGEIKVTSTNGKYTGLQYGYPIKRSIACSIDDEVQVYTFSFNKYTPYAGLEVGVVDYLKITNNGTNDIINVYGDIYSAVDSKKQDQLLYTAIIDKSSYIQVNIEDVIYYEYRVKNDLKVYYKNDTCNHIEYKGIKFNSLEDEFIPAKADEIDIKLPYSEIGFTLKNVHYDNIIYLISTNKNATSYKFEAHILSGASLGSYNDELSNISTITISENTVIEAKYSLITYLFKVRIDNLNAYYAKNTNIIINGQHMVKTDEMQFANVSEGSFVSIQINSSKINSGYYYVGTYIGQELKTAEYTYNFTMSIEYHEKIIELRFAPIIYTIKLKNIDGTDYNNTNATFVLTNSITSAQVNNWQVTIDNNYTITAVISDGYYIADAYIKLNENPKIRLESLIGNNNDGNINKLVYISGEEFIDYIVNNAETGNIVNIYIDVSIDKFEVTLAYFNGVNSLLALQLPNIYYAVVNDATQVIEDEQWVKATDLTFATNQTVECNYNQYIAFKYDNLITGFKIVQFAFYQGQNLPFNNGVAISGAITSDLACTATIELTEYNIKFKRILKGEEYDAVTASKYGTVTSVAQTAKIQDIITFTVNPNGGYKFVRAYYNTESGQSEVNSGFTLIPVTEAVTAGPDFNIFIEFDYTITELSFVNNFHEMEQKYNIPSIATQSIEINETLINTSSFNVSMGDMLDVEIITKYNGVRSALVFYVGEEQKQDVSDKISTEVLNGEVKYYLQLQLNQSLIELLGAQATLKILIVEKDYDVEYKYNFIDEGLGLRLKVDTWTNGGDVEELLLNMDTIYNSKLTFGSNIKLYYQDSDFDFIGYEINGYLQSELVDEFDKFILIDSLDDWNMILDFIGYSNTIKIELIVSPEIILEGGEQGENVYTFTTIYNGRNQTIEDSGARVVVKGVSSENISIKYYLNSQEINPVNVGQYQVEITVSYYGKEFVYGKYGDDSDRNIEVRLVITQKELTVGISNNKISKTYDGTNIINDIVTVGWKNNLILNGLCGTDGENVSINFNTLVAYYNSNQVSAEIDIVVEGLAIVGNNHIVNNYWLKTATRADETETQIYYQIFNDAGAITKRTLSISGVKVYDKVYNANGEVVANVDNLTFSNMVEADKINVDKTKLYFYCQDFEIGRDKIVSLDYSKAMTSDIINNYNISYIPVDIDIYPNRIEREVFGVGIFAIEDRDNLCLIPFDSQLNVNLYSKEHEMYREIYPKIEALMKSGDRYQMTYEFVLRVGDIDHSIKAGLYLTFPDTVKSTSIFGSDGDNFKRTEFTKENDMTVIKLTTTKLKPMMCCVRDVVFMPLWLIITIISSVLGTIGLGVVIFIIVRRRREAKLSSRQKI